MAASSASLITNRACKVSRPGFRNSILAALSHTMKIRCQPANQHEHVNGVDRRIDAAANNRSHIVAGAPGERQLQPHVAPILGNIFQLAACPVVTAKKIKRTSSIACWQWPEVKAGHAPSYRTGREPRSRRPAHVTAEINPFPRACPAL